MSYLTDGTTLHGMPSAPKTAAVWVVVLAIGSVCFTVLALGGSAADARTCTVFAATYGGKSYFGSNVDHPNTGSSLWFWPASEGQHGGVLLGYHGQVGGELMIGYEGGMNDQGLAFDTLGLPDASMTAHPEKPTSWNTHNFWRKMLRECADVDEAIAMANSFDFGKMMDFQTLVMDSAGATVVIGPGPDGELGLTTKARGDGHIVATNFNLANPEHRHGPHPCPRHETATKMLARFEDGADFTLADAPRHPGRGSPRGRFIQHHLLVCRRSSRTDPLTSTISTSLAKSSHSIWMRSYHGENASSRSARCSPNGQEIESPTSLRSTQASESSAKHLDPRCGPGRGHCPRRPHGRRGRLAPQEGKAREPNSPPAMSLDVDGAVMSSPIEGTCLPRATIRAATTLATRFSCAGPQPTVRGRCGQRLELSVNYLSRRRHLPLVELQRAA